MNSFDPTRVEADITTLNDALTCDPPERWLAAYQRLEQVDAYLACAQHTFRWVLLIGFAIFLAGSVATFLTLPRLLGSSIWMWFCLLAVTVSAPDAAAYFARRLAERREPLLKVRERIKDQLAKFSNRADAPNSTKHHVPA